MELKKFLSEADIKRLINFILRYIADLDIPVKRYVLQKSVTTSLDLMN
jgi:hypothetical protein